MILHVQRFVYTNVRYHFSKHSKKKQPRGLLNRSKQDYVTLPSQREYYVYSLQ